MPLAVSVADVLATAGNLWIAIDVVPGELVAGAATRRERRDGARLRGARRCWRWPRAPAAGAATRETPEQMQARIDALQRERDQLRARQTEMVTKDPRLMGMPGSGVRVGIPTPLVRTLVQRVLTGFVDSVTLKLTRLKVHKAGTVKKVVTIGTYDLNVVIDEVTGQLETGEATLGFGGDQITVALPVKVKSGSGDATIDFTWDGKNVSGAVCGDMTIKQKVSGSVKPASYPVSGGLLLTADARQILASPRFPVVKDQAEGGAVGGVVGGGAEDPGQTRKASAASRSTR